jgi:hypothetical protein
VAQQTPYNLVDRSGTVLAACVAALAERLFAEKESPAHRITVASYRPFSRLMPAIASCTALFRK